MRLPITLAATGLLCGLPLGAASEESTTAERFAEVQRHLQTGGSSYWIRDFGSQADNSMGLIRSFIDSMPEESMSDADRAEVQGVLTTVEEAHRRLGLSRLRSAGGSSAMMDGFQHDRWFVYLEDGTPGIWSVFEGESRIRRAPSIAHEKSAVLLSFDYRGRQCDDLLMGIASMASGMDRSEIVNRLNEELPWELVLGLLARIDGEVMLALSLDFDAMMPFPLPNGNTLSIPYPDLHVALDTYDEAFFREVLGQVELLTGPLISEQVGGATVVAIPRPPGMPPVLSPMVAWDGDFFHFSTNAPKLRALLAADGTYRPLEGAPEYSTLASIAPGQANGIFYISSRVSPFVMESLNAATAGDEDAAIAVFLAETLLSQPGTLLVHQVQPTGWSAQAVSTGPRPAAATMQGTATVGMLTAIAVPSFLRAREISRRNACQMNQSVVDGAKQQWALENNKPDTATPTWDDLVGATKYIRTSPVCPSGGRYIMNDVGSYPQCSLAAQQDFPHAFPAHDDHERMGDEEYGDEME